MRKRQVDGPLSEAAPVVEQSKVSPELGPLSEAIYAAYTSTIAAFALRADETEYDAHDARAQQDAERVRQLFSAMHADLSPEVASSCEALVDRIDAAQLAIMSFAINRKNRGFPDGAQAEAELADRDAFKRDAEPLYARLQGLLPHT